MIRIAVLVEDMFEEMELLYPYYRCKEEGFQVDLVGTDSGAVYKGKYGIPVKSDLASKDATAPDYDAIIIPGGYSPDKMRRCPDTIKLVTEMNTQSKIIAAICHGPWMLASCCDLTDRQVTAFFSIKDDLLNAGAVFVDAEVVVDGNLITSRTPSDLPTFVKAIFTALKK